MLFSHHLHFIIIGFCFLLLVLQFSASRQVSHVLDFESNAFLRCLSLLSATTRVCTNGAILEPEDFISPHLDFDGSSSGNSRSAHPQSCAWAHLIAVPHLQLCTATLDCTFNTWEQWSNSKIRILSSQTWFTAPQYWLWHRHRSSIQGRNEAPSASCTVFKCFLL